MKKIECMEKKMRNRSLGDGGFSLVELIIVIAIMAILVGIVGTQVLPYLNRSREAKDQQILDAYATAAVSAYSFNAESIDTSGDSLNFFLDGTEDDTSTGEEKLKADINELAGYDRIATVDWSSTEGKKIKYIHVVYDWDSGIVTVTGADENKDEVKEIQGVDSLGVIGG